jgi:alpha-methylacyl-CoA racemase
MTQNSASTRPLEGLLVLDFTTLLPGPFASLLLTEAGARVVKIERPQTGDDMRSYEPKLGDDSVNFVLLNRGKDSIAIDLKAADSIQRLRPLIERADVVIEQFRPGVMDRLGLGYEALKQINPGLIYCAITGWGQTGPKAMVAAHDLNYMAEAGVLGLSGDKNGAPVLPPVLVADIAGGGYPAVVNILLALRHRDRTGMGSYLDIAMGENLLPFAYWGLGNGFSAGAWPGTGDALVTGATPRYQIYRTADGRYLAAAPLEQKFWNNFCSIIALPDELRAAEAPPKVVIEAIAEIIGRKSSAEWTRAFDGHDVCCSIVARLEEAAADPHFAARNMFSRQAGNDSKVIPALPVPIVEAFRDPAPRLSPALGDANDRLLGKN